MFLCFCHRRAAGILVATAADGRRGVDHPIARFQRTGGSIEAGVDLYLCWTRSTESSFADSIHIGGVQCLSVRVCVPAFSLSIHFLSLSLSWTESSQRCCDRENQTHLDHRERETPTLPFFLFSYVPLTGRKCIQPILLLRLCVRCVSDTKAKDYIRIKSFVFGNVSEISL